VNGPSFYILTDASIDFSTSLMIRINEIGSTDVEAVPFTPHNGRIFFFGFLVSFTLLDCCSSDDVAGVVDALVWSGLS